MRTHGNGVGGELIAAEIRRTRDGALERIDRLLGTAVAGHLLFVGGRKQPKNLAGYRRLDAAGREEQPAEIGSAPRIGERRCQTLVGKGVGQKIGRASCRERVCKYV